MRYSASHKAEIREKLIAAAGALSKKEGFDTTGVDALMATVGLTGGAFYGHFKNKGELLEAIVDNEMRLTQVQFLNDESSPTPLRHRLQRYLSRSHLAHPELGCPLPSLSSEVARANASVKATYERHLEELVANLSNALPTPDPDRAWAILAMAVGGITLARTQNNPALQEQVLNACVEQAMVIADQNGPNCTD
ncbi:MAG: TetR/AcrR family transcriptional regulator [Marinobacter sp.]